MVAAAAIGAAVIGAAGTAAASNSARSGARAQANAASSAADLQAQAANRATDLQQSIYTDQRNLTVPNAGLGAAALARQARMAGLTTDEINQFYNSQMRALNTPFVPTQSQESGGGVLGPAQYDLGYAPGSAYGGHVDPNGPNFDYAARDLGNLDEFAPQQFQFGAQELYNDPSYAFRRDQGQAALERSAAARGLLFSGATGQALIDYNQDYASQEYDNAYTRAFNAFQIEDTNRWNRLGALSGAGANAQAQLIQGGQNFANNVSQNMQNAANAGAAGIIGAANARASGYQAQGQMWNGFANNLSGLIGFGAGNGWFSGSGGGNGVAPQPRG